MQEKTQNNCNCTTKVLTAIILTAIMLGSAFFVWYQYTSELEENVHEQKPEEENAEEIADEQEEEIASNYFSWDTVKVGDKVGLFTVTSVEPFNSDFSDLAEDNIRVKFSGQATISGAYSNYPFDWGIGTHTVFFTADESQLNKIWPIMQGDEINNVYWFSFNNAEFAKDAFAPEMTKGDATIVIDNYEFVRYPSEVGPTAELVEVVEISNVSEIEE